VRVAPSSFNERSKGERSARLPVLPQLSGMWRGKNTGKTHRPQGDDEEKRKSLLRSHYRECPDTAAEKVRNVLLSRPARKRRRKGGERHRLLSMFRPSSGGEKRGESRKRILAAYVTYRTREKKGKDKREINNNPLLLLKERDLDRGRKKRSKRYISLRKEGGGGGHAKLMTYSPSKSYERRVRVPCARERSSAQQGEEGIFCIA